MSATDKLSSRDQTSAPGPSEATLKAVAAVINDHRIHYGARLVKMVDGIETYTARVDGHDPKDFEDLDEALAWARGVADADRAKLVVAALLGQQGGAVPAGDRRKPSSTDMDRMAEHLCHLVATSGKFRLSFDEARPWISHILGLAAQPAPAETEAQL